MPVVDIKHTPTELAVLFGALNNHQQAEFFNALAEYAEKEFRNGEYGFAMQMESVRQAVVDERNGEPVTAMPALNSRGMAIMKMIGGDY